MNILSRYHHYHGRHDHVHSETHHLPGGRLRTKVEIDEPHVRRKPFLTGAREPPSKKRSNNHPLDAAFGELMSDLLVDSPPIPGVHRPG